MPVTPRHFGQDSAHRLATIPHVLLLLILACLLTEEAFADPVRIGVLAFRPAAQTEAEWEPLREALATSIPERELLLTALNYGDLESAVADGALDFVLTNPGHDILLLHRYGLSSPLATRVNLSRGVETTAFGGVIITRAERSEIAELADLSGHRIACVNPDSLGGFQSQAYELMQAGERWPEAFDLIETGMPHDRVVEAVLTGEADAGFLRSGMLESLVAEGQVEPEALRVINPQDSPGLPFSVSTPLYPEWPFAALPEVDSELSRQVTAALLGLRDQPDVRAALGGTSFTVPSNYMPLEKMLRALELQPFGTPAPLTLADFWREYWLAIVALSLAFLALLGLVVVTLFNSRRLSRLLERVQELSAVIDRSPVVAMTWSTAPGWPVTFVSDSIRTFGYEPEALLSGSVSFDKLIHPDDLARVVAEVGGFFADGPNKCIQEYRFKHGNGHWIQVLDHTWLSRDSAGRVTSMQGILMDVTERKRAERHAAHMRKLMEYVIEHNKTAVAIHDRDMNYVFVSQKYLEQHGLAGQNVIGRHHYEVFPDLPQRLRDVHARVLQGEVLSEDEDQFVQFDGSVDWARWECRPWFEADGDIGGLVVYIEIITERKKAELALREKTDALVRSNERLKQLATVFTHAHEGILITDPSVRIIEVNESFSRITGYSRDEALGKNPSFLSSGRHGPEFYAELWQRLKRIGYWSGEIWNQRKNGEIYQQAATISAVTDENDRIVRYVALFTDVSEEKRSERQLEYVSRYDVLTGLPNRKLLTTRLRQAMAECRERESESRMAVVFLDLDEFKSINDQFGSEIGDAALSSLTRRLRARLGGRETLGRIGGDELVVLLLDLESVEEAMPLLEQLRSWVSEPLNVQGHNVQLTASMGVCFYPQPEEVDAEQLLRQADQAMYQAKLAGKNCFHLFSPEEDQAARGLNETLLRLRRALDEREFVLHYQPRVNMRTGEVLSAEALIRWQHPEQGLLPPGQYLPLLEKHPLALEIGLWVIESALEQLARWQAQGLEMAVSVNVFGLQLQQPDFAEKLRQALQRHPEIRPGQLEIEVLETSALEDIDQVSAILKQCQELGVSCALDDFGTGYSTLNYLKRLPANILKIDQGFVRDMLDDPEDLAILHGILGLARAFRRQPVAEGVETEVHGNMLLDLGCEIGQGYGIARPMKADDLASWLSDWRPPPSWYQRPARDAAEVQLLFAAVEHRAWVSAMTRHVESGGPAPLSSVEECPFGQWLAANAEHLIEQDDLRDRLDCQHRCVHAVGEKIRSLVKAGDRSRAVRELEVLYCERDKLLGILDEITPGLGD